MATAWQHVRLQGGRSAALSRARRCGFNQCALPGAARAARRTKHLHAKLAGARASAAQHSHAAHLQDVDDAKVQHDILRHRRLQARGTQVRERGPSDTRVPRGVSSGVARPHAARACCACAALRAHAVLCKRRCKAHATCGNRSTQCPAPRTPWLGTATAGMFTPSCTQLRPSSMASASVGVREAGEAWEVRCMLRSRRARSMLSSAFLRGRGGGAVCVCARVRASACAHTAACACGTAVQASDPTTALPCTTALSAGPTTSTAHQAAIIKPQPPRGLWQLGPRHALAQLWVGPSVLLSVGHLCVCAYTRVCYHSTVIALLCKARPARTPAGGTPLRGHTRKRRRVQRAWRSAQHRADAACMRARKRSVMRGQAGARTQEVHGSPLALLLAASPEVDAQQH